MTNSLRMRVMATVLAAGALVGAGASAASADHDPVPEDSGTVIMSDEEWEAAQALGALTGMLRPGVYYTGSYEPLH